MGNLPQEAEFSGASRVNITGVKEKIGGGLSRLLVSGRREGERRTIE